MTRIATVMLMTALTIGMLRCALADTPGPDWMRADQVIQKLLQSGYSVISKIEADDGRWEGQGIKNGLRMEFHADAKSGVVTFEKLDD